MKKEGMGVGGVDGMHFAPQQKKMDVVKKKERNMRHETDTWSIHVCT